MTHSTRQRVTRGAIFLYVENVAAMFMGYLFWLIITKLTTSDVIGTSGAIVSLSAILSTIINLGIPISVQRFLGKCFIKHQYLDAKAFVNASIILLLVTTVLVSTAVIMLFPFLGKLTDIKFDPLLILITIGLSISSSVGRLFRGIVIASLKTRILLVATVISTASKFFISFILLFLGLGVVGLTIGVLAFAIVEAVIILLGVWNVLYSSSKSEQDTRSVGHLKSLFRPIIAGGIPNWIPTLITSFGAQLGTVVVFGLEGSYEAGYYFIAFSIYSALTAVVTVVFSITFPVLSSLEKGQADFTWRVIRLSLVLSLPLAYSFFFYPSEILSIFGADYANGAMVLDILILSLVPIAIIGGFTNMLYAKGDYRRALIIGIGSSLPRVVLYLVFVPFFGGNGAALAFTIGSFFGLIIALYAGKPLKMNLPWVRMLLLSLIPIGVSLAIAIFPFNYVIAIPVILVSTYLIYLRSSLVNSEDLKDAANALPARFSRTAMRIVLLISRRKNDEKPT